MRYLIRFICFCCLSFSPGIRSATTEEPADLRAPFVLEFPTLEKSSEEPRIEMTAAHLNGLRTIKILIKKPFDEEIREYSKVHTFVNGEAVDTCWTATGRATNGKFILLDLALVEEKLRTGLTKEGLRPDKNVLEINARSSKGRTYYASFVLLTGRAEERNLIAAEPKTVPKKKYAVLIGISEYQYPDAGLDNLRFAHRDAEALREFLLSPAGGSFAKDDIICLTNKDATLTAVRDRLKRFLPKAQTDDLVYLFIAGHGFPDPDDPKELYFALHDSRLADLPHTAMKMSELQSLLNSEIKANRVIAFIDTCHSAGVSGRKLLPRGQKATGKAENNLISLRASQLFSQPGRSVITSSDLDESSYEDVSWGGGHGAFTWSLLEGMRGAADADADGYVTSGEIYRHLRQNVPVLVARLTGAENQHPTTITGTNENLVIAYPKAKK